MTNLKNQLNHSINFHLTNDELKIKIQQELEREKQNKREKYIAYNNSKDFKMSAEQFLSTKLFILLI